MKGKPLVGRAAGNHDVREVLTNMQQEMAWLISQGLGKTALEDEGEKCLRKRHMKRPTGTGAQWEVLGSCINATGRETLNNWEGRTTEPVGVSHPFPSHLISHDGKDGSHEHSRHWGSLSLR